MFFYWCSYTLCIQTIMNTNKVNVSACLPFIKHYPDTHQVTELKQVQHWRTTQSLLIVGRT